MLYFLKALLIGNFHVVLHDSFAGYLLLPVYLLRQPQIKGCTFYTFLIKYFIGKSQSIINVSFITIHCIENNLKKTGVELTLRDFG